MILALRSTVSARPTGMTSRRLSDLSRPIHASPSSDTITQQDTGLVDLPRLSAKRLDLHPFHWIVKTQHPKRLLFGLPHLSPATTASGTDGGGRQTAEVAKKRVTSTVMSNTIPSWRMVVIDGDAGKGQTKRALSSLCAELGFPDSECPEEVKSREILPTPDNVLPQQRNTWPPLYLLGGAIGR